MSQGLTEAQATGSAAACRSILSMNYILPYHRTGVSAGGQGEKGGKVEGWDSRGARGWCAGGALLSLAGGCSRGAGATPGGGGC